MGHLRRRDRRIRKIWFLQTHSSFLPRNCILIRTTMSSFVAQPVNRQFHSVQLTAYFPSIFINRVLSKEIIRHNNSSKRAKNLIEEKFPYVYETKLFNYNTKRTRQSPTLSAYSLQFSLVTFEVLPIGLLLSRQCIFKVTF